MAGPGRASRRKLLGAWYTPAHLAAHLVEIALDGWAPDHRQRRPLRVLDPACGDGRFLAAVAARWAGPVELTGVDVDDRAVASARAALPSAELVHDDALTRDWSGQRFDLVIGNPPFLNQLATATSRGGRSRFGGGPYADVAAEFLALAAQLVEPRGGRIAFVLPQSLLAARDAGSIRAAVADVASIRHCWWSTDQLFDANVRTCALVLEAGASPGPVRRSWGPAFAEASSVDPSWVEAGASDSWAPLLLAEPVAVPGRERSGPSLGDLAVFTVDFRDQYYGLVGAVGDDVDGPPFVTSGLIEPGRCLWGERPVRFAKQRFEAPRVALDRLSPRLQEWARRRLVPKILVANQTRVIEAVHDPQGAWLPGVPVISCTTHDPDRVLEVLGRPSSVAWVRHHAAGTGLSADTFRLTPALLASIPLEP